MQNSLSFEFQLMTAMLAGVFSILDIIPLMNVITNSIYGMILTAIFIYKYLPLIRKIAKSGISIGFMSFKIGTVSLVAFILDSIPFVSIVPWSVFADIIRNRMIKKRLAEMEKLSKNISTLKYHYENEVTVPLQLRKARQQGNEQEIARYERMQDGYRKRQEALVDGEDTTIESGYRTQSDTYTDNTRRLAESDEVDAKSTMRIAPEYTQYEKNIINEKVEEMSRLGTREKAEYFVNQAGEYKGEIHKYLSEQDKRSIEAYLLRKELGARRSPREDDNAAARDRELIRRYNRNSYRDEA